jgi:hypothetical protein
MANATVMAGGCLVLLGVLLVGYHIFLSVQTGTWQSTPIAAVWQAIGAPTPSFAWAGVQTVAIWVLHTPLALAFVALGILTLYIGVGASNATETSHRMRQDKLREDVQNKLREQAERDYRLSGRAELYRNRAHECRARAARATDPDQKQEYLEMADGWQSLAGHAERLEERWSLSIGDLARPLDPDRAMTRSATGRGRRESADARAIHP